MIVLKDVCSTQSSNIAMKDLEHNNGQYPIYGASGFIKNVDFYKQEKPYIAVVKDGAGVGRIMKLPAKSSVIGTMQYILPNDNIDISYLAYAMENMNLSKYYTGTTIPHIYFKDYCKEKLSLHTLNEQKYFSKILDTVTELVGKHNEQLQKLDELVKAGFVEMFGTLHDNKKDFNIVSIEDVCSLIKDGTHQTPTYTEDKESGYKFLSSKDVMSQKIDWSNIKYIPKDLHEKLYATLQPQKNDILMSKNGVNYGVAAVNNTDEIFDIYVSLALLRPLNIINPAFLKCVINTLDTKRQFDASIKGIGVPNLHLSEIKKTKIMLPPIHLQNEFVLFESYVDKQKLQIQKSLKKIETLKMALMQRYFG